MKKPMKRGGPNRPKQVMGGKKKPYSVSRMDDEGMPAKSANQVGKAGVKSKKRRAGM